MAELCDDKRTIFMDSPVSGISDFKCNILTKTVWPRKEFSFYKNIYFKLFWWYFPTLTVDLIVIVYNLKDITYSKIWIKLLNLFKNPNKGGVGAATAGTLSFMLGGPKTEIEAASSILEFMGAKIFPCGDVGTGQVAKVLFYWN